MKNKEERKRYSLSALLKYPLDKMTVAEILVRWRLPSREISGPKWSPQDEEIGRQVRLVVVPPPSNRQTSSVYHLLLRLDLSEVIW